MNQILLISAVTVIAAISVLRLFQRFGVPVLLLFIIIGMAFGSDGIFKVYFDNYELSDQICSIALIFLMFFGGFDSNWSKAKKTAPQAIMMSSLGVILTWIGIGGFCWLIIGLEPIPSFLLGAVISSTDAASVFSILRSKQLNLRHSLASLLEIESGSNDPMAYTLVMIMLAIQSGQAMQYLPFAAIQITMGIGIGFLIGFGALWLCKKIPLDELGSYCIWMMAIALLSYALASLLQGNGYLSVYITGIVLGNHQLAHKVQLAHFFEGITTLMQMVIFFLLGLLCFPSRFPDIIGISLILMIFLTFVLRPCIVFLLLSIFHMPMNQRLLISWSGIRGASSIVFAIYAISADIDIFHIVFCICLMSLLVQGTLLPYIAEKLQLIDHTDTVMKTFNDYQEIIDTPVMEIVLQEQHEWINQMIKEISFTEQQHILMILRDHKRIIPKGTTRLKQGDRIIYHKKTSV